MDVRDERLRPYALEANFGLEREALRVTAEGRMARTPHPFPVDHPRIVRDFCENQTEINTRVHPDPSGAVAELRAVNADILRALAPQGECLWPFSNPPAIRDDRDIVAAKFDGPLAGKSTYRDYLAEKYGPRLMTFCGIHANVSFGERLLAAAGGDRDELYLHVAGQAVLWGWLVVALTAASPLLDASFLVRGGAAAAAGPDAFTGFASVRCGDLGYWNPFTPVLDFSSVRGYAASIEGYVRRGYLAAPSELYHPVRLKPRGPNRLPALVAGGIDHLELRCLDLNPLCGGLIDVRDVQFLHLLLLWCAARPRLGLTERDQLVSVRNFKSAARYDLDLAQITLADDIAARWGQRTLPVRLAGLMVLAHMRGFFADFPQAVRDVIDFQIGKLEAPETRYAAQVMARFSGGFATKALALAKEASAHV